ncbi:unnamed protein product, partial [Prorocentrum cordatum]
AGGEPTVVRFLTISMLHAFGDGNCYMPIAEDLMALYDAARSGEEAALPSVSGRLPFEALQARLQDCAALRPRPRRGRSPAQDDDH